MDLFDQVISNQNNTDPQKLLEGLNPEQAEAVQHAQGPLLILAGAGSGKTRVITHRIAWLVAVHHVRPAQILAITFTNKAAAEMKSRVEELVGQQSRSMWIGTFHSMMIRILRRFADRIGFERSFAIIDTDDQQRLIKKCLKALDLDEKKFVPRAVHSQIGSAKNALTGVEAYAQAAGADFRLKQIAEVYKLYQQMMRKNNSMDFDDILFESHRLLNENPDVLSEYQERFRHVLVDEYQDTNHAQYELVRMLSDKYKNLCVVGDDDQSIYSFRGANIQNILDFEKDFKGCKVIKLEQNYRSTGTVLDAANAVIKSNRGRKAKKLWTSSGSGDPITFLRADSHSEESRYIAAEIVRQAKMSQHKHPFRDMAILYRLNALSRNLEFAFREQGVPYRIFGGMRFYDRKEIKDVVAYLRLILIPDDDLSLVRAIQVPRRGVGNTTLQHLADVAAREDLSQLAICRQADRYPELAKTASRLRAFADLIDNFRAKLLADEMGFAEYVEWIENESGMIQEIIDQQEKGRDEAENRIENLKELLSDALEFENSRRQLIENTLPGDLPPEDEDLVAGDLLSVLSSFIERTSLYAEIDQDEDDQNYVRLMTIHSAKGLEFDTVFLIGAEEGLFPGYRANESEAAIEEERRLAYVAITRARKKLYITTARSRLVFGQTQSFAVSRFIREIPEGLIEEIGGSRFGDRPAGYTPDAAASQLASQSPAASRPGRPDAIHFPGAPTRTARQPKPSPKVTQSAQPDLKKGDQVRHAKFGAGKITDCQPVAGDAIIVIKFDSGQTKRLMAKMARLEKI